MRGISCSLIAARAHLPSQEPVLSHYHPTLSARFSRSRGFDFGIDLGGAETTHDGFAYISVPNPGLVAARSFGGPSAPDDAAAFR